MYDDMLSLRDYKKVLDFQTQIQNNNTDFVKNVLYNLHEIFKYNILSFFQVNKYGEFYNPQNINFGDEAIEVYTNNYYKQDPFYFKNLNNNFKEQPSILLNEITDNYNFNNSEYYVDFFNKYKFSNEIALYIKDEKRHIGAMGILQGYGERVLDAHDKALLSILSNVISYNYSEYLEKEKLIFNNNQLINAMSNNPVGIIITDNKLNITYYNECALNYCNDISPCTNASSLHNMIIDCIIEKNNSNKIKLNSFEKGNYNFKIFESNAETTSGEITINSYIIYITPIDITQKNNSFENIYSLTDREMDIVELLCTGLTNKAIAEKLYISPQTVRTHVRNIMTKTNSNNRTEILFKVGKIIQ